MNIIAGILLIVIAAVIVMGSQARDENQAFAAAQYKLSASAHQHVVLDVDLTGAKLLGSVSQTSGRHSYMYREWTAIEAKDWLLVNPRLAGAICPTALATAVEQAKVAGSFLNPESLDIVLSAFNNKSAKIGAYVPAFDAQPVGLGACLGFSYDNEAKTLKVGGRTVGLFANEQPGLALGLR